MFFINIDYSKEMQKAKLYLSKPNKNVMSHIHEKFNMNLSVKLGGISELTFSIPHYVNDETGIIRNPHVDSIREKMLIKVEINKIVEWFIVDSIEEDGNDEDIFNVTAFSLGYELSHKRISYLGEAVTCNSMANEILSETSWKVGTIDPEIEFKQAVLSTSEDDKTKRTLEINDSNALDCIIQIAEAFNAVLMWDTNNKTVSFKDLKNIGKNKGLKLNYGQLLKSIKRSRTTDELVTRMYAFGSEDLTIAGVNPTGQMYIEDFSFFMHPFRRDFNKNTISSSYFMSDELCHAILNQQELVQTHSSEINSLMSIVLEKQLSLQTEQTKLTELELELQSIVFRLDTAKASENVELISQIEGERVTKQSEVESQKNILLTMNTEIDVHKNRVESLRNIIATQAGFNNQLYEELNYFIIEKEWRDDRYINASELFEDAKKRFISLREPKVVITVDIENLFEMIDEQYYWDKLNLGDLVEVKYPHMNIEYIARIIEIGYDFEGSAISVTIANTEKTGDEWDRMKELLSKSQTASSILENHKYKWDRVTDVEDEVYKLLLSEWDANKRKIIAGVNNQIEIGNRGIIIRNPDFPNEMVIMQSGIIALSKDNGDTWKTAIKPDGIVAERIIGNLIAGRNLIITNGSKTFTVDEDGVKISGASLEITGGLPVEQLDQDYVNSVNIEILEAKEALDTLERELGYMFTDSKITQLEAKTMELSLKRAISESEDIIRVATSLNIGIEKTEYSNSLNDLSQFLNNKYLNKTSYPIDVTVADRKDIETKFSVLEDKKSKLTNAIVAQREKNANKYTDEMRASINDELDDVLSQLDGLSGYIGDSFRDGVIEEAEAISIGAYINSLNSEKSDLDNKYVQLYTNTSLINTTVKSDLLYYKNNYNTAHADLITAINTSISDRKTTTSEKSNVDSKFSSYRTALASLTTAFEKALDAIGIEKARQAEQRAKDASVGKGEVLNGVKIDVQNGLVVTTSNNTTKVTLNASRGFTIQKNIGSSSYPNYSDVFYIDTNGNIIMKNGVISWDSVNAPSASAVGALPINSDILTKITSNGVYTGTVTTNQLVAGTTKIKTAMIEDLVVGGNVSMGVNASISWGNITNRPTIPSSAGDIGALPNTYIDANGVWTGYVNASKINSGKLSADRISGGTIDAVTITGGSITSNSTISVTTDARVGNNLYLGLETSTALKMIKFKNSATISSPNGTYSNIHISAEKFSCTDGDVELGNTSSYISINGTLNLSNSRINWGNNKPTAVFG